MDSGDELMKEYIVERSVDGVTLCAGRSIEITVWPTDHIFNDAPTLGANGTASLQDSQ
jgi:hypothetical protein